MKQDTEQPAAQLDTAADVPTAGKTRRPRRMAREPGTGDEPPASKTEPKAEAASRGPSKIDGVIALLSREQGATLAELIEATGWLPHTTRAALTGLRKSWQGSGLARHRPPLAAATRVGHRAALV